MQNSSLLSKREAETVTLLLEGKSNKQIAAALGISEHTVEYHLKHIYTKLQVNSRAEAILKLGKSAGLLQINGLGKSVGPLQTGELGESVVAKGESKTHNKLQKYLPPFLLTILFTAAILAFELFRPSSWEGYARECEYPDIATVGQMLTRSNASAEKVHGQFGTGPSMPFPAVSGYVQYNNIRTPATDTLYLMLRYSKYSTESVTILVYLDNESVPRATIYPVDQHSWDQFVSTEPIFLGKVSDGIHSIKFSTDGEQYGVADLDSFVLTAKPP